MRTRHALGLATAAALLTACSSGGGVAGFGDPGCAAIVEYDGHRYWGHGELVRTPATTGRTETGVLPGCDDGNGEAVPEEVTVEELEDLPLDEALLVNGSLYVRGRGTVPAAARVWFEAPTCDEPGAFELTGAWVGVQSRRKARFDGDIRPPYRISMWVDRGPASYVGTRVTVRAEERTDPHLGPKDIKQSLWKGGDVTARVHCQDGRFVADALTT